MPRPSQKNVFPVQWGTDIQIGPDGVHWWVTLMSSTPFSTWGTTMPPAIAREMADKIPSLLRKAAGDALSKDSAGLLIAPANALDHLPKGNMK